MPEGAVRRLLEVCPRMSSNYAMTETLVTTVIDPTDDAGALSRTVGRPFDGVDIRLVNDLGEDVELGTAGELLARSDYNMLGYWRRHEATQDAFSGDGWFHTGDLLVENEDGSYSVVGRLKDMYKSGGYNVYPEEIEKIIESYPDILEAAVVAVSDPRWQEVGIAYVTLQRDCVLDQDRLWAYCSKRLANYKIPKKFSIILEMPFLPIGKVDKGVLRKNAAREFGP